MKRFVFAAVLALVARSALAADNTTFEATSQDKAYQVAFSIVGGLPDAAAAFPVKVLVNRAYVVGYSEGRQNPLWSAYHVDKVQAFREGRAEDIELRHDRPDLFYTDTRTAAQVPGSMTFRRSGRLDRGHMTPNNAIQHEWGRLAQLETFLMSNICPQNSTLNSGLWRSLEHAITEDLVAKHDDVWVIAGPVFGANPRNVQGTQIQIPAGFYMIIVERFFDRRRRVNAFDAIAFRFPNASGPLSGKELDDFVVPVDDVETAAGLDFFTELNANEAFDESVAGDFEVWFGD